MIRGTFDRAFEAAQVRENVSSTMGSLTERSDPASPWYEVIVPAYISSKAALNAITVELAKLLRDTPIKVNSICPGGCRPTSAVPITVLPRP